MIYHLSKDVPLRRTNTNQISSDSFDGMPSSHAHNHTLQHSLSDSAASDSKQNEYKVILNILGTFYIVLTLC